jgi:formamidopyrimidine-DNA glycosylase
MPELPEVETTVAGLRSVLEGRVLTRVEPRRADLRVPFPPDLRWSACRAAPNMG